MQVSAGGVVYRIRHDGVFEVKLIKTKSWKNGSLPKGHVEGSDTLEVTAIREVLEESGVKAIIEEYLGKTTWKLRSGDFKDVHIFLMRCVKDGEPNDPDKEILSAFWKTLDEAIALVDFIPMKKMLLTAATILGAEKMILCKNCLKKDAILLNWCEKCLKKAKAKVKNK